MTTLERGAFASPARDHRSSHDQEVLERLVWFHVVRLDPGDFGVLWTRPQPTDERFEFGPNYIIPKPFDPRVLISESIAVAKAAMDTGVARIQIDLYERSESGSMVSGARIRRCGRAGVRGGTRVGFRRSDGSLRGLLEW